MPSRYRPRHQASVDAGAESLDDVQATLPVALNCGTGGKCRSAINEALQNKAHDLLRSLTALVAGLACPPASLIVQLIIIA